MCLLYRYLDTGQRDSRRVCRLAMVALCRHRWKAIKLTTGSDDVVQFLEKRRELESGKGGCWTSYNDSLGSLLWSSMQVLTLGELGFGVCASRGC